MSDADTDKKRRGIDRTAKLLREQSVKAGRDVGHDAARDRVVRGVTNCENRRNSG